MTDQPPHDPLAKYRRGYTPSPGSAGVDTFSLLRTEDDDGLPLPDAPAYVPWRMAARVRRLALYCGVLYHSPAYANLLNVTYSPQGHEVALVFSHATVLILGRHLQTLGAQLFGEKVAFVQAFDAARWPEPDKGEACIDSITFASVAKVPGSTLTP